MISQVSKNGAVRFVYSPDGPVKKVSLAGTFNNWKPAAMKKQPNGLYAIDVKVPKGQHEYKFVVDGQWYILTLSGFRSVARVSTTHGHWASAS